MDDLTEELLASAREAREIMAGRIAAGRVWAPPAAIDVDVIRARTGLSQQELGVIDTE